MKLLEPAYFRTGYRKYFFRDGGYNMVFIKTPINKRVYPFEIDGHEFFAFNDSGTWNVTHRTSGFSIVQGKAEYTRTKKEAMKKAIEIWSTKTQKQIANALSYAEGLLKDAIFSRDPDALI